MQYVWGLGPRGKIGVDKNVVKATIGSFFHACGKYHVIFLVKSAFKELHEVSCVDKLVVVRATPLVDSKWKANYHRGAIQRCEYHKLWQLA